MYMQNCRLVEIDLLFDKFFPENQVNHEEKSAKGF